MGIKKTGVCGEAIENMKIERAKGMNRWVKEVPILDVGCGEGEMGNFFVKKGYSLLGLEYLISDCLVAKKRFPVVQGDIRALSFKERCVKVVIMSAVLAHGDLFFQEHAIKEAYRVLKENGTLVILTVNRWTLSLLRRIGRMKPSMGHIRELSPIGLYRLLHPYFKIRVWENHKLLGERYLKNKYIRRLLIKIFLLGTEYFLVCKKPG